MVALYIFIAAAVIGTAAVIWAAWRRGSKKPQVNNQEPKPAEQPEPEPEPEDPEPTHAPTQEPEPDPEADYAAEAKGLLGAVLRSFEPVMPVAADSLTYRYLLSLSTEALAQYRHGATCNGLPLLVRRELFPTVADYWAGRRDEDAALLTMLGWLTALQLTELDPFRRNALLKAGYEAGGHTMESPVFGWEFRSDPNVVRICAGILYAAMRSSVRPDTAAMRREVGGNAYGRTLYELWDGEPRVHVTDDAFYIDLRRFMASAPGPYAPGYKDRSRNNPTFPDAKTKDGCLETDMDIHGRITGLYNLPDTTAVQAIADKDWEDGHLFGEDRQDVHGYDFAAVFGRTTTGMTLPTEGALPAFVSLVKQAGSSARGILQHADRSLGPVEYGRLRPGCSWEGEGRKHSATDDHLNVLADFWIEDGDGNPTGYYDAGGEWVHPEKVGSPDDYEEMQKRELYANSYPSGHSSGITAAAMALTEIYPMKADLLLREANTFAMHRAVARYHWTSDTIQGRVVGTAMAAVCHAAPDYDSLLDGARAECGGVSPKKEDPYAPPRCP